MNDALYILDKKASSSGTDVPPHFKEGGPKVIASLSSTEYREDEMANARLITAAPDLLAALAALLPEVESEVDQRRDSGNNEYWQGLDALATAARTAIAKATTPQQ